MKLRTVSIAITLVIGLSLVGGNAFAATVFSTGFDGNSGSVPVGWTDIGLDTDPQSTIVESGTVAAVTDFRSATVDTGGPQLIQSNFTFTAPSESTATVMLTVDIAGITTNPSPGDTDVIVALGSPTTNALVVIFHDATNTFDLAVAQASMFTGSFSLPTGPHLPGYAGGPLTITLALDADSVRLTSGVFDSGDLLYTTSGAPGLVSLVDLGAAVSVVLGASAESSGIDSTSTVNFDSVLLDISGTSPPPPAANCDVNAPGVNVILGTEGKDKLKGTPGDDVILGLGGNDTLDGKGGNDCLDGGDGKDKLDGGNGDDRLYGGLGKDTLDGDDGNDRLYGGDDKDKLKGDDGNDELYGEGGDDQLDGDDGDDLLDGGEGTDKLDGDDDIDTCLNGEKLKRCEL